MRQQRLEWAVQRVAWPLLSVVLVAIALGLFGQGPLAKAQVVAGEDFSMEYHRFARRQSPDALELRVVPREPRLRVSLARGYTQAVDVEHIFPEPDRMAVAPDATVLEFDARPGEPFDIRLQVRPSDMGRVHGWVAVGEGPRHVFSQFVYP